MREQSYLDRAKLNPARTFKTPRMLLLVNVARCSSSRIRSAIHQRASRSSAHE